MKILTLFYFIFLLVCNSFAQQELLKFDNSLQKSKRKVNDIIPIVNKNNNDINLLFFDRKYIYSYLINEKFEVKQNLKSKAINENFTVILGNNITENDNYRIFLSDYNKDRFISVNFSYKSKSSTISIINLDLNLIREKFVQTINYNNKFYLITVSKNSSILNIYEFNDKTSFKKHKLDLSNYRFIDDRGRTTLYKILKNKLEYKKSKPINKFVENIPSSLELTSNYTKLYVRDNKIVFTFDQYKQMTQILSINLDDFEHKFKKMEKPFLTDDVLHLKKSNSFLHQDKIYQLAVSSEELVFFIKNLETGKLIKSYSVKKSSEILFKNSPIMQEEDTYMSYRDLDKTKKFLRKLSFSDVGISVYNNNYNYFVTIGGTKEITKREGMMAGEIGFTFSSLSSTFINCKFDNEFNHVKGTVRGNSFDIITLYKKLKSFSEKGETIFKYKNYHILGYYDSEDTKYYHLRKI